MKILYLAAITSLLISCKNSSTDKKEIKPNNNYAINSAFSDFLVGKWEIDNIEIRLQKDTNNVIEDLSEKMSFKPILDTTLKLFFSEHDLIVKNQKISSWKYDGISLYFSKKIKISNIPLFINGSYRVVYKDKTHLTLQKRYISNDGIETFCIIIALNKFEEVKQNIFTEKEKKLL